MFKKLLEITSEGSEYEEAYDPNGEYEFDKIYPSKQDTTVLEMCRKCYSFKYENGWHFGRPKTLPGNDLSERISVQFSQCPACVEEFLARYDMECA